MTILWIFLFALLRTEAFSVQTRRTVHGFHSTKQTTNTKLSLFSDDDTKKNPAGGDFSNFNPFSYQTDTNKKSKLDNYAGTQISLRKTDYQALTNELLNMVQDPEQVQVILQANREFLLEPLEDDDAYLDPDSVYTANMSRAERYQAYRTTMEKRLATAKNPSVRQVLTALFDFVMSHE
jgi:hypothetical protein